MDFPVSGHSHVMLATRECRSARRAPERERGECHVPTGLVQAETLGPAARCRVLPASPGRRSNN